MPNPAGYVVNLLRGGGFQPDRAPAAPVLPAVTVCAVADLSDANAAILQGRIADGWPLDALLSAPLSAPLQHVAPAGRDALVAAATATAAADRAPLSPEERRALIASVRPVGIQQQPREVSGTGEALMPGAIFGTKRRP